MTPLITFASSLSPALARFAVFLPRTSSRTNWRVKEIDSIIIMEKKKPSSSSARLLFTATSNTCSTTTKCNKGAVLEEEEEEKTQTWEEYDQLDIQSMTINQLRTMSKKVGIPSRGSKHELVSALNCFLAKEKDGKISSAKLHVEVNTMDLQNVKSGKNSDEVHLQNSNISVSKFQPEKRKRKSLSVDDVHSGKVSSSNQVIEKESSVSVNVVSDTKLSIAKRKTSSPLVNGEGRVGIVENSIEPWTILVHKKPQQGWVPYNPKKMRPPPPVDGTESLKLISWNVNGLRALLRSEGISTFAQEEKFDILCLQETKLQEKDVENIKQCLINGYENSFWTCSVSKLGYSGSAIISRVKPLSVRYGLGILDHDTEGRLVTVEFDTFYLISGYVPNSGDGLKRLDYRVTQWDPSLSNYMKELEKSKPVILTGDLNCAHQEIDIFNPAGNRRSAGFTDEERESFQTNFLYRGFVDTFRRQHPDVVGYTYWGYRHRQRVQNKGWRLDYFLVSESVADKVHDSYICPHVTGSDHCPIGLILKL